MMIAPFSGTATTRDSATGSLTDIVVAVTASRAPAALGPALDAGAGVPDPVAGAGEEAGAASGAGVTAVGALADVCDVGVAVFGAGCACREVQPASTSARTATAGATLLVTRKSARPLGAIAQVTDSLLASYMTNA